jgi:hypothetical protein
VLSTYGIPEVAFSSRTATTIDALLTEDPFHDELYNQAKRAEFLHRHLVDGDLVNSILEVDLELEEQGAFKNCTTSREHRNLLFNALLQQQLVVDAETFDDLLKPRPQPRLLAIHRNFRKTPTKQKLVKAVETLPRDFEWLEDFFMDEMNATLDLGPLDSQHPYTAFLAVLAVLCSFSAALMANLELTSVNPLADVDSVLTPLAALAFLTKFNDPDDKKAISLGLDAATYTKIATMVREKAFAQIVGLYGSSIDPDPTDFASLGKTRQRTTCEYLDDFLQAFTPSIVVDPRLVKLCFRCAQGKCEQIHEAQMCRVQPFKFIFDGSDLGEEDDVSSIFEDMRDEALDAVEPWSLRCTCGTQPILSEFQYFKRNANSALGEFLAIHGPFPATCLLQELSVFELESGGKNVELKYELRLILVESASTGQCRLDAYLGDADSEPTYLLSADRKVTEWNTVILAVYQRADANLHSRVKLDEFTLMCDAIESRKGAKVARTQAPRMATGTGSIVKRAYAREYDLDELSAEMSDAEAEADGELDDLSAEV